MPRVSASRQQTDLGLSLAQAKGLKPYQRKQLQRLYQLRLPPNRLVTVEFAQRLGALTQDLESQPISVYLNRRGQVIRVGLGSPFETQIPAWELPRQGAERLSGIRCITTQVGEGGPSQKALTAMALQRLDALILLSVSPSGGRLRRGGGATGFVNYTYLAHLVPQGESRWQVSEPLPLATLAEQDLQELVAELEDSFRRQFTARQVDPQQERAILVGLQEPGQSSEDLIDRLAELGRLVESAGGQVLQALWQRREGPNSATVIGSGKVQELALLVQDLGANLVVFDRELTPSQVCTLEQAVGVRVVDRSEVILDIFAQRARTRAGKLQVELAQLQYLLPRLAGRGRTMSRLGGWDRHPRPRGNPTGNGAAGHSAAHRQAAARSGRAAPPPATAAPATGGIPNSRGGPGGLHQRRQVHPSQRPHPGPGLCGRSTLCHLGSHHAAAGAARPAGSAVDRHGGILNRAA